MRCNNLLVSRYSRAALRAAFHKYSFCRLAVRMPIAPESSGMHPRKR